MSNIELYIDMDEVLVNLSKQVISIHNKDFNEHYNYKDNKCYWWSSTGKPQSYFEKVLDTYGTHLNAPPKKKAIKYIEKLFKEGYKIYILTSPRLNKTCCYEKIEWIKTYLPFLDINKCLIFTSQKHLLAQKNRLLLDDNPNNLDMWHNEGGISLCFGSYGWNQNFIGNRILNWEEAYKIINKINNMFKI